MNLTLHSAADSVRLLLDQMDEHGELPDGFHDARSIVATKALAVTAYIVEDEKQADMIEAYAKDLMQRVKTARKRGEWLRGYLASHMAACGVTSIKDERGIFSAKLEIGRDESVDVFDVAQVPADYMREVPATSAPDKLLMKKAMKDGFEIPGVKMVKRDRLVIR